MTALALLLFASVPDAGTAFALKLEGDLVKSAALSLKDLKALGPMTVDWLDPRAKKCAAPAVQGEQGCTHKVTGIRLDALLQKLGFSEGLMGPQVNPREKHRGLRAAVIASAPDGFEAVFSLGELLESLGATTALVVWDEDGKPLPPEVGPVRILVLTDKGRSRSLHQLTAIRVVDLEKR